VRKICASCKTEFEPAGSIKKVVEKLGGDIDKYHRGVGCKKCRNSGYAGRIAIHELFVPNEEILEMINDRASLKSLRNKAIEAGMVPLVLDGLEKVKAGIVSIEEVLRTAHTGDGLEPEV
jgi:type IV pilus assembly protein PilB